MARDASKLLRQAAIRSRSHEGFVGYAFAVYQDVERMSEPQLAAFLNCSVEVLEKLSLCQRPTGDPTIFKQKVLSIAAVGGVDPHNLGQIFQAVDAALR